MTSIDESEVSPWGDPSHGWDNAPDVTKAKRYCQDHFGAITESHEGQGVIREIAHRLRAMGISARLTTDLIMTFAKPPVGKAWVAEEVDYEFAHSIVEPGTMSIAGPLYVGDEWTPAEEEESEDDYWLEGGLAEWPKALLYDAKQHNAKLAEVFMEHRPGKIINSDGILYSLEGGKVWRELPEEKLAAELRLTDPALLLDTPRIFGMVAAIKLATYTTARPFEWISAPYNAPSPADSILFANGVLNIATGERLPHTGQYFATGLPEFRYDPKATCPTWDRCVGEWLDSSFHDTLHEWLGYVMTPDTSAEKLLALIGARRGGKSTILRVMSWLVGASHVMSRSVNDLGNDFGLEGCLDAKLMVIPDAHDTELNKRSVALDRIKTVSGNDQVSVNRKFKGVITAKVPTRIAIAANRHPKFLDDSGALAARELVLIFETSFAGKEDQDLSRKLRAELPGIANRALEGLRRLRSNRGVFTVGAQGRAAAREVAESQSPALRFAKARLRVTGDRADFEPLADVFASYEEWSTEESLSSRESRNRDDFKNDLIAALRSKGVKHTQARWHDPTKPKIGKGKPVRGFFGLRLTRRAGESQ